MNYTFQLEGVGHSKGRKFTYQSVDTIELREDALDEHVGIGSSPNLKEYTTRWHPFREERTGSSLNWNNDGHYERRVAWDLDGDNLTRSRWPAIANEWATLKFTSGGTIGSSRSFETLIAEQKRVAQEKERELQPARELDLAEARADIALRKLGEFNAALQQIATPP